MRTFLILFILLATFSCAKNDVEKSAEAIDIALTHLSNNDCDEALEVLQELGNQPDNAVYFQVLSSAHACKADFDEVSFISSDLSTLNTTSTATIFLSLAKMQLSNDTSADSIAYTSILSGINVLLGSTTGSPSHTARVTKFGTRKAGDMSVLALFLNIVNLGKFLNYYGDAGTTGVKASGSGTNICFIDYNDPRARTVIDAGTAGACVPGSYTQGHSDIDQSTNTGKRRLCEGLMLLTNTIDILDNLNFSSSTELSVLETISTQINTVKTAAVAAGLGTLINMTSQSDCETAMATPANLNDMEYLYALMFENGLQ